MNKDQENLDICKLFVKLARLGSTGGSLDDLLTQLSDLLENLSSLQVASKRLILLFNSRRELVPVAQQGFCDREVAELLTTDRSGLHPDFRPDVYISSLHAEAFNHVQQDECFLVLPLVENGRPLGEVLLFIEHGWLPDAITLEFMSDLAGILSSMVTRCHVDAKLQVREIELQEARTDAIQRLGRASEYRDNETGMHVMRMTHIAGAIAKAMELPEAVRETLLIAAPMHDVGKIGIEDAILLKPGRLTPDEFAVMKKHTEIGGNLLMGGDDLLIAAHEIALTHHESWDGSGYPNGLKGDEIPLYGRICSVADVFDALTSPRPYKEAWSIDQAITWINEQSGQKFDPKVVAAFHRALPEIQRILHLYREDILDPRQIVNLPDPERGDEPPFVAWTDDLSIGIDIIDMHHRHLFDLINDLHRVAIKKLGSGQVARVLRSLSLYAKVHFRALD